MFTQCPSDECLSVYRVKVEHLQRAMGMVRCPRCKTVFNALSTIRGIREEEAEDVQNITRQLPYAQLGDRIVLSYRAAAKQDWFKKLKQAESDTKARRGTATRSADSPAPAKTRQPPKGGGTGSVSSPPANAADEPFGAPSVDGQLPRAPVVSTLLAALGDVGLALRNVLRQGRRSALGLGAITFGVVAMLLAGGFIEWSTWELRRSTIRSHLGHIQVVRPAYFDLGLSDPFAYLLPERSAALDAMEKDPRVTAVAPRLAFSGLIAFGDISVSFTGEGVVAEKEKMVSSELALVKGSPMASNSPNGVIVGKGLAANLAIEVGDTVVLLGTTVEGTMNAVEGKVRGIFQTASKAYDDVALRVPLDMARELMRVSGAHKWVVLLDSTEQTDEVLAELEERFPQGQSGLQFVPWIDLADFYKKTVVLLSAQMNVVRLVIAIIIVVSISNTLAMSIVERTSEIGTLMAVGLRRRRILSMFVNEGVVLGIVGGLVGVSLGVGLGSIISAVGIPMPPAPGSDFGFRGEVMVTWPLAIGGLMLAIVATLIASIYPAWKASRLEIVDALRHSR